PSKNSCPTRWPWTWNKTGHGNFPRFWLRQALLPAAAAPATPRLSIPVLPGTASMGQGLSLHSEIPSPARLLLRQQRRGRVAGAEVPAAAGEGAEEGDGNASYPEAAFLARADALHVELVAARPLDFIFLFAIRASHLTRDFLGQSG